MSTAVRTSCWLIAALALTACRPGASELWAEHCASCHGLDGRGVEPHRTFYPNVDLTRSELVAENARGPIYTRIAYGWEAMPGFSHKLRQSELEKLVEYSLALGRGEVRLPPAAQPDTRADGTRSGEE
jgi:mono/diheme cytochrome c family protein